MRTSKSWLHLIVLRQMPTLPEDSVGLLVASTAGRAASGRLFIRLVGRAAGGGLLLRLVGRATSSRLVRCAASRTSPTRQIRECHNDYLRLCLSNFSVRNSILTQPESQNK